MTPTTGSVLQVLSKPRLIELGRIYSLALSPGHTKEAQIRTLVGSGYLAFRHVIRHLTRDELKAACEVHGLDDAGRSRPELAQRLIAAHGDAETQPIPQLFASAAGDRYYPKAGDIVSVRHRQWLVERVAPPADHRQVSLVSLVCLDDDNQGRRLDVLWELELGAKVLQPEAHGLGDVAHLDPPRFFGAYLHALKWNAVTATDARLFQSPFRAGIKLMNHQLLPLKKALELPRANLFIADDVGLGKTIEAGLVLQELLLRQQIELILIVCPASVTLQWRDEMAKRFGLHFEIYNRELVARRRRERGFGVNPWRTHQRFIISYQTLRRPEYRDLLQDRLGKKARKSLLIFDEAHTIAPASGNKYIKRDSQVTKLARVIAPAFENRLFLSATPHNGHSTSFSALLEILDPQRFTRGVAVSGVEALAPVMVRRLKSDLRDLGVDQFPRRDVVQVNLGRESDAWTATYVHRAPKGWVVRDVEKALPVGPATSPELELAEMLARYTALMRPEKGVGQLVFKNLQKRLLSSVEAFARTLSLHAKAVGEGRAKTALQLDLELDEDADLEDEVLEEIEGATATELSRLLRSPEGEAKKLLEDMVQLAERHRSTPDAKVLALVDWIRRNQNEAVQIGGARGPKAKSTEWSDRRLLVFTEYGDTKNHLVRILGAAIAGTKLADERIRTFHGGMSDAQREDVQLAFNGDPEEHPVRILIATDAAREGVNLQGRCADLFHFDIPWNPARMEQRNGRIDRTLQPAPEVRCHYFFHPGRTEDVVLSKLVEKVETIQEELGSLGTVVMDRFEAILERGIDAETNGALEAAEKVDGRETVTVELEAQRKDKKALAEEIDDAGKILNRSREVMDFDPVLLKDAIDVGLELSGAGPLEPLSERTPGDPESFELPELSDGWQSTLDTLRRPRRRDESFWDWRRTAPEPVVFRPPERIQSGRVHLHLEHPFTKRVLDRFRAQGYSAHDLSRVTVVRNRHDSLVRVIAFGRLSLFGPGATRLHDQLVSVAAKWLESGGEGHLRPFADRADRKAIELLETILKESPSLDGISKAVQDKLVRAAPGDFAKLWPSIQDEADALAHEATQKLLTRGKGEAEALRELLRRQREAIDRTISKQLPLAFTESESDREEQEQWAQDQKHMRTRLEDIAKELETEPREIEALYHVTVQRLEPVGLVYLWPETRG